MPGLKSQEASSDAEAALLATLDEATDARWSEARAALEARHAAELTAAHTLGLRQGRVLAAVEALIPDDPGAAALAAELVCRLAAGGRPVPEARAIARAVARAWADAGPPPCGTFDRW